MASLVQVQLLPVLYQRPGAEGLVSGAEAGATVLHEDPLYTPALYVVSPALSEPEHLPAAICTISIKGLDKY
jgi:hypothetical protein